MKLDTDQSEFSYIREQLCFEGAQRGGCFRKDLHQNIRDLSVDTLTKIEEYGSPFTNKYRWLYGYARWQGWRWLINSNSTVSISKEIQFSSPPEGLIRESSLKSWTERDQQEIAAEMLVFFDTFILGSLNKNELEIYELMVLDRLQPKMVVYLISKTPISEAAVRTRLYRVFKKMARLFRDSIHRLSRHTTEALAIEEGKETDVIRKSLKWFSSRLSGSEMSSYVAIQQIPCSNYESCAHDQPNLAVPARLITHNGIQEKHRNQDHNGFFVSSGGSVYCSRSCWAKFCE